MEKLMPDYTENIIVGVFCDGKFDWYVTDKEIWYLDYKKRINGYKEMGFDIKEECIDNERQGLLILNSDNANIFLERIENYKFEAEQLRELLIQSKTPTDDTWQFDFRPSLYVNFDTHQLFSLYSEPAFYEDYVPSGWEGEDFDFMELIPENQRYWMRENRNELIMDKLTETTKETAFRHYKTMKMVSGMVSFAVVVFGIFIPLLCLANMKNIMVTAVEVFVSVFLAYAGFCLGREYLDYVVLEKCDFYSHQLFLGSTKSLSRFKKKRLKIKLNLLNTYFALGWYEQGLSLLEELRKEWTDLPDAERLRLRMMEVSYAAETALQMLGSYIAGFYDALESAGKVLHGNDAAQLEAIVRQKESLYCGKWEDALAILETMERKNVYQQSAAAYWMGVCYLKLGQAGEAAGRFAFAAEYGGNSKYAAWAQERLDKCEPTEKGVNGKNL